MELPSNATIRIGDQEFEIIKSTRILEGMVLKSGDTYARVGDKQPTLAEQTHTISLYQRGFPVPKVLNSGELGDGKWYFTETSLGDSTFHDQFHSDYQEYGRVLDVTVDNYLKVISRYAIAQTDPKNKTTIEPAEFINTLLPKDRVLKNYCYFGHSENKYLKALAMATNKLSTASMGIIQHDFNPFNVLDEGVIDFELAGYGPVGFDTLMSARWSAGWFTDYPSRYPVAYKLSFDQVKFSDELIDRIAVQTGCPPPTQFMQEFLLLKSAWAVSDLNAPDPSWPSDRLGFRKYRANILETTVNKYLRSEKIDYTQFSKLPGAEQSA